VDKSSLVTIIDCHYLPHYSPRWIHYTWHILWPAQTVYHSPSISLSAARSDCIQLHNNIH